MKIPVEQHYTEINGEFVLTSEKCVEVEEEEFACKVAELISRSFK